jgi:hypothetical protein
MTDSDKQALFTNVSALVETIENCTSVLNEAVSMLLSCDDLTSQEINSLVGINFVTPELQSKLRTLIVLH